MPLERDEPRRLGFFDELFVQFLGRGHERHVHDGAVLLFHAVGVELRIVDEVVQKPRLVFVDFVDLLDPAQLFEVTEHQVRHVDGEAGRRVVQRAVFRLRFPFEHGRALRQRVFNEILAGDDDGHAGRGDVLLRARIDDAEFVHVDLAGKDLRAHVGDQRRLHVGEFHIAGAEDGVVRADVHIVRIVVEGDLLHVGDIRVSLVLGGGDAARFAEDLALLPRLFGEVARDHIVGFARVHQVQGHGGELLARAALHKEHAVIFGDVHQFAQVGFRLFHDGGERFIAVADLAYAHARSGKIEELFLRFFQHVEGEHGRACRKIVNSHK